MKLNPYLHFAGNAEEALNFYKDVFDGEILMINRYGDNPINQDPAWKEKIMHARLTFDGNLIMLSDVFHGAPLNADGNVQLSFDVESIDRINEVFAKISEGGKVTMELQDTFWGARFGMLKDKFGISWMFNHELKK